MSGIAIYLEGGGQSADTKAALRRGFDAFLKSVKDKARAKGIHWKLVPCGGRDAAYHAYINAQGDPEYLAVLIVDSEAPLNGIAPIPHLINRDGWTFANPSQQVYVMVEVMETLLLADQDALAAFYGQGFNSTAIPKTVNLELVPKANVENALERATRQTKPGIYHKIKHAEKLLAKLDEAKIRSRCPNCDMLFKSLEATVQTLQK